MSILAAVKNLSLTMFSQPVCDRGLYKAIKKNKVASIVEFGVGNLKRTENMIRLAKACSDGQMIRYTGVDMFEANENGVSLKAAHLKLKPLEVKTQLVPGEMLSSLVRIANSHTRTDLIVVSSDYVAETVDECWFYFPRMLHATSLVFVQDVDVESPFKKLTRLDIERKTKQKPIPAKKVA